MSIIENTWTHKKPENCSPEKAAAIKAAYAPFAKACQEGDKLAKKFDEQTRQYMRRQR